MRSSPFLEASAPRLSAPEWVERHRIVVDSAFAGPWDWRHGFMSREILAAASDRDVKTIALVSPAQLMKTETCINIALHSTYYGDPVLFYEPDLPLLQYMVGDRIRPSLQALGAVSVIGLDDKLRKKKDSRVELRFGGSGIVKGLTPEMKTGDAAYTGRVVILDELDKMGRGDILVRARSRVMTYGDDALVFASSTPTIDAPNRIWRLWEAGSAGVWTGKCPHCAAAASLDFARVQIQKDADGHWIPESAAFVCASCGAVWAEADRLAAIRAGGWVHERPDSPDRTFRAPGCAHIRTSLYEIVREGADRYREAREEHDWSGYAAWRNERIAEPWDESDRGLSASTLSTTTYSLGARGRRDMGRLDERVCIITAGVDVGARSLHAEFVAWGVDPETERVLSWGLQYVVIGGDPSDSIDGPELWDGLDTLIRESAWRHPAGASMVTNVCLVDTQYRRETVLDWIRDRYRGEGHRRPEPFGAQVLPSRGHHVEKDLYPINLEIGSKAKPGRALVVPCVVYLQTQMLKTQYWDWMVADRKLPSESERAHRYPDDAPARGYDSAYFREMSAEVKVPYRTPQGRPAVKWEKRHGWVRGEAWDCRVYALAGLYTRAYPHPLPAWLSRRMARLARRLRSV